jgi:hypothetical protein
MKARVKATGEIVEIIDIDFDTLFCNNGGHYTLENLDGIECDPDYWERLEHQYAGMALQGILANSAFDDVSVADIAITSIKMATSLIKRLKEERK